MTGNSEAAADLLTGAVVASSVDTEVRNASRASRHEPPAACLNCGAPRLGAYCSECGQPAHIHRSFMSLGHDLLHSVFHFEGRFWRTMPELIFRPGRLTRRYIDGERAKFISPMALFLFTVFLMYAVFAFLPDEGPGEARILVTDPSELPELLDTDGARGVGAPSAVSQAPRQARPSNAAQPPTASSDLGQRPALPPDAEQRPAVPSDAEQRPAVPSRSDEPPARQSDAAQPPANGGAVTESDGLLRRAVEKFKEDPALVAYKIKSNGYKFSWLLVPLSIPFMWLLFFWRREFRLYDHAIFVTYSISFMTLLMIASTLADAAGAGARVGAVLMMLIPPLHIYKQLRGAYGLSRRGALVRLFFVLVAAWIVISIFVSMLFLMGALE